MRNSVSEIRVGSIRGKYLMTTPNLQTLIHMDICTYTTHTNTDDSKYKL